MTKFRLESFTEDDAGSCSYEGARHQCTFFLFCALVGGTSVGTCPGSLLTSCCVTQETKQLRRSPTVYQPHSQSSDQRIFNQEKGLNSK